MGGGRRCRQVSIETLVPEVDGEEEEEGEPAEAKGFFACYLLCSLSPRHKGHTYIGFTVNPRRRIRQHNGEITSGAWRTKHKRPWEMIFCIYGFPTNVNALQFEWAWQHPRESLAVRKAAESFKYLSGIANKIKIAYTMLTLPNWEKFNLTINFFSSKYLQHAVGCPRFPKNMRVNVCIMDELPCYMNGQTLGDNDELDDDNDDEEDEPLESIVNQPENEKNPSERTSFEDCDGPSKPADDIIYPFDYDYDYFIRSPVRTQIGYSWQLESNDPVQPSEFVDDCPGMPIKLDSGGNSREDTTASSSSCSANHSNQTTNMKSSSMLEPSTPMTSGADKNTRKIGCLSPTENDVINLLTPSSCIILSEEKRPRVWRQIIDLTESPVVIHL